MTDEECIAIATLHGCLFADIAGVYPNNYGGSSRYFVHDWMGEFHPMESAQEEKTGSPGWPTREALARDYCEFYELLE